VLQFLQARVWGDQKGRQIVEVKAEVVNTVSAGLFLVRIAKGSYATLELDIAALARTRSPCTGWSPYEKHVE